MSLLTYPTTFAQSIWLPFPESASIGALIADAASTLAEFITNRCNWVSASGLVYSETDMLSLWEMISQQKMRVQAFWLISIGAFSALDPALRSLA